MFKRLKHVKTLFIKRIASETRAQRKLFSLLITSVLGIKKITNLSGSVSFNQAVIINITKTETSHKKKLKL